MGTNELNRVLDILDHEIILKVNAINRAIGREAVLLARGWAKDLLKVAQELLEVLDKEVSRRGCANCDDQCMTCFVSCAKGESLDQAGRFDRYAGTP